MSKRKYALDNIKKASALNTRGSKPKKISNFSHNVRIRREELGMSQGELAEKVGVHQTRVSRIEGGAFPEDPDRIIALSEALYVSIDWLFRNGDGSI